MRLNRYILSFGFLIVLIVGTILYLQYRPDAELKPYIYDCASHIEFLPEDLKQDVNDSCSQWLGDEHVTIEELDLFFATNEVLYSEEAFFFAPGLFGYIRPAGNHYEMYVAKIDIVLGPIPQILRRRTAFHETGHLIMLAMGFAIKDHVQQHELMNQYNLCPEHCPSTMAY